VENSYVSIILINVRVPMRDGICLAADCYLPSLDMSYPVILQRSPYSITSGRNAAGLDWCKRGFAFVCMDCRRKSHSEGEWNPVYQELNDGYDTLDWISKQPWCNGNIGMIGGSYSATTQMFAAASGHPALKAIAPSAMGENQYDSYYTNGVLELSFKPSWLIGSMYPAGKSPKMKPNWKEIIKKVPVADFDKFAGMSCPRWHDIVGHPWRGAERWEKLALHNYAENIRSAFFITTSYFDLLGRDGIGVYTKLINNPNISEFFKKHSFLRIGPWGHGVNMKEGAYTFGADSLVTENLEIDFLTSILTEKEAETDRLPGRICYFTMGENKWHFTDSWPLPDTDYVNYYLESENDARTLHGNGRLSLEAGHGKSASDSYTYDPENPCPSCGGRMVGAGGQRDQSEIEQRSDVLVYTSQKLSENLTVTGNVCLILFFSSSAPDTDFTAKLVDVYPDGRPMSICDGIQRVCWRNGVSEPCFLKKGEIYEMKMDIDFTSYQFKTGHAIRLEISSSNFPHYERNMNTGRDNPCETEFHTAQQTVYHNQTFASRLILPVIRSLS